MRTAGAATEPRVVAVVDPTVGTRRSILAARAGGQFFIALSNEPALNGKYTIIAEGARGSLSKVLMARFDLTEDCQPQKYGIGLKELWEVRPELHRPFKTPWVPFTPILGIVVSGLMMVSLPGDTWLRLLVWLIIGMAVYFFYGRHHSRVQMARRPPVSKPPTVMAD